MHTWSSDEKAVCLSVRLSVKRVDCDKMEERSVQIFIPDERSFNLVPHLYADDTQVYGSCAPSAVRALSTTISKCLDDVVSWASSNRLQLNPTKTEVMWCAASAPATILCVAVFRRFCRSGKVCTRSGNPHRCRSVYADARTENGITVL